MRDIAPLSVPVQPVRTTCPYCGVGCGVLVTREAAGTVRVAGDPEHPANYGRLCSKGASLDQTIGLEQRLLQPRLIDALHPRDVGWDEALDEVARRMRAILAQHGPASIALYVSGQLLTEDYYVANKLVKGWLGTANIDTNSRLCMASAVAGYKRAFGEDVVPCSYEDLELADLVILVGSNAAWCHPVIYQRLMAARERRPGTQLVVIDPRRTPSCDQADLHLPIQSGTDGTLFNGLLAFLAGSTARDTDFISARTSGFELALEAALSGPSHAEVARICGIEEAALRAFYQLFEKNQRVVTVFSQGINQSSSGTDKVNAIINCHLATGRIGIPGAGPFSITGQPNAMGGREVGGLANTLAAHMDLDNPAHRDTVQRFWGSPHIANEPGLKAVELFEAIGNGQIKAVWIIATNPLVSLPMADAARAALAGCELVVVSDCVADTDTARMAHILLPAAAWGEKDGTVTNSERRISRQRAFLPAPGAARPDWWIVCEVAKRLGFTSGFNYTAVHEIFVEHAQLSAQDNDPGASDARLFNLAGLTGLGLQQYDALEPVRWPVHTAAQLDQFLPTSRRARFVAIHPRPPVNACSDQYPMVLNTGRIRDQWHTMTRTGKAWRLGSHRAEPFVEVHPDDALIMGVRDGELARVFSQWGAVVVRVVATPDQRRGNLFVPIHWSSTNCSDARIGAVVNPVVDPLSGEPEFKHTPVAIEPFAVDWYGFALSRDGASWDDLAYWARSTGLGHTHDEIAGRGTPADRLAWAQQRFPGEGHWLDYSDASAGVYRAARIHDARLMACVFMSSRAQLPSRTWLASLFEKDALASIDRLALLAGRASAGEDSGATVCACFGVGRKTIELAIRNGASTAAQIGSCVRAGTNCGSCLPELRRLLAGAEVSVAS